MIKEALNEAYEFEMKIKIFAWEDIEKYRNFHFFSSST